MQEHWRAQDCADRRRGGRPRSVQLRVGAPIVGELVRTDVGSIYHLRHIDIAYDKEPRELHRTVSEPVSYTHLRAHETL